jgi:hypothetical protein
MEGQVIELEKANVEREHKSNPIGWEKDGRIAILPFAWAIYRCEWQWDNFLKNLLSFIRTIGRRGHMFGGYYWGADVEFEEVKIWKCIAVGLPKDNEDRTKDGVEIIFKITIWEEFTTSRWVS